MSDDGITGVEPGQYSENDQMLADMPAEHIDSASVAERQVLRNQIQSEVEAFLAAGGQISVVEANLLADPPKKPQSNYGGQPI